MKKFLSLFLGLITYTLGANADIKIPKNFENYKHINKILSDRSYPERNPPRRIIEYDNNGDGITDVKEIYPMKYYGRNWVSSLSPIIYKFDKDYNGEFEEEITDLKAYFNWKGYHSKEET